MKRALPLVFAAALTVAPDARAEEPVRDIDVRMLGSAWYNVGFVALNVVGLYLSTEVIKPVHRDRPPLDGLGHRERIDTYGRAADIGVVVGLGTGAGLAFLGELGSEARGVQRFRAPVVVLEGALAGSMLTQLVKNFFGICRPRDWDDETRRCTTKGEGHDDDDALDEAHRSFPSGHSAPLAGMAGAALGLYLLPSTPRREQLSVALTSIGFALTVVVLREKAGAHSWVDTGAAFISGGLAGFLTAALHLHTVEPAPPGATTTSAPVIFTLGSSF